MAKIDIVPLKVFGASAPAGQVGVIGSFAAASPATSKDLTVIQSLSNYLQAFYGIVDGDNSPAIEDMNGIIYLITSLLSGVIQNGVQPWLSGQQYYINSIVMLDAQMYIAVADNIGSAPSLLNQTNWRILGSSRSVPTATGSIAATVQRVFADATAGSIILTLPALADVPIGYRIMVKCINTNANTVTIRGNGSETIDGVVTYGTDLTTMDCLLVEKYSSTQWFTVA